MIRRTITARYAGRCRGCAGTVEVGASVVFIRQSARGGRGSIYHVSCAPGDAPASEPTADELLDDEPTPAPTPAPTPDDRPKCAETDCDIRVWQTGATYCGEHVCAFGSCDRPHLDGNSRCDEHRERRSAADPAPFKRAIPEPEPTPEPEPAPPATVASSSFLDTMAAELIPFLKKHGFEPSPKSTPRGEPETIEREVIIVRRIPDDPHGHAFDSPHPLFETLLRLLNARQHVYLWGAPGGGKSHAAHAAATALGVPYRYVSLSPQSMPSLLMGYMDAHGKYVRTAFRECFEFGGVFCIDEVDNCNGALLASLNSALANGVGEFPDAQIPRHADCVIVATGNTPGMGGTQAFPERRALDLAFRDRFAFVEWTYAPKWERSVARKCHANADAAESWCKWIINVRKWCASEYPALVCSPRASFKGAALLGIFELEQIAEMVLFQGINADVRKRVLDAVTLPAITITDAEPSAEASAA